MMTNDGHRDGFEGSECGGIISSADVLDWELFLKVGDKSSYETVEREGLLRISQYKKQKTTHRSEGAGITTTSAKRKKDVIKLEDEGASCDTINGKSKTKAKNPNVENCDVDQLNANNSDAENSAGAKTSANRNDDAGSDEMDVEITQLDEEGEDEHEYEDDDEDL